MKKYASVWDSISDTPGEAEVMKVRSTLMLALRKHADTKQWSADEAAKRFGVTGPRLSEMMAGKIDLFTIEELIAMTTNAGLRAEFTVTA